MRIVIIDTIGGLPPAQASLYLRKNSQYPFTPDHRNWGGGTFTAQNQRLVYWPMLKAGDFDLLLILFRPFRTS